MTFSTRDPFKVTNHFFKMPCANCCTLYVIYIKLAIESAHKLIREHDCLYKFNLHPKNPGECHVELHSESSSGEK